MGLRHKIASGWRTLFGKARLERELDEELRGASQALEDRYRARGMSADEARRAARIALGGVEPVKEAVRDVRIGVRIETLAADLHYAARMLRKSPAFTAAAVLSLALGIGANTAIFTFINALLLRPLPVRDPAALVELSGKRNGDFALVSFPIFRDLSAQQQVLTGMVATAGETPYRLAIPTSGGGASDVDNVRVSFVSGNYFSLLGLDPARGRLFTPDDDRTPDSAATAGSLIVLSDGFWQRQFGRDPSIVGRTILMGRTRVEVVGVTPPGFTGEYVGAAADGWVPLTTFSSRDDLDNRQGVFTAYFGRLRPGVSMAEAQTQLTTIYQRLLTSEGRVKPPFGEYVIRLDSAAAGLDYALRRTYRTPLFIVMGMVAAVLLIACANIANLLLARATARAGEISVCLALGCSRSRLVGQLLAESALLSIAGAAAGLLVSRWATATLAQMILGGPVGLKLRLAPDVRVIAFLGGVAILTTIVFGLAPALRSTRVDLAPTLKGLRRGGGSSKQRAGRALVVAQVAVSLLLLVGAGLLIRSFRNLHAQDFGFSPENVLIFSLAHGPADRSPAKMGAVERTARERVLAVAGVQSASFSGIMLFSPSDIGSPFWIPGQPIPADGLPTARYNSVSPGYFETVGMRLVAGRSFTDHDDSIEARRVTVVNESFQRRFFPDGAVGRTIGLGRFPRGKTGGFMPPATTPEQMVEIIGVVHDAKYNNLREDARPLFFLPFAQMTRSLRALEVRTDRPASAIAGAVRDALSSVTPDIMIRNVIPLSEQVDASLAAERLLLRLCVLFGGLALLLACVGLYGVIAYRVAQRSTEIGVRVALGATPLGVMRGVLRETMVLVLAGVAIGVAAPPPARPPPGTLLL